MIVKIPDTHLLTIILTLFSFYNGWLFATDFQYLLLHVVLIAGIYILLGLGITKKWQKIYSFLSKILLLTSAIFLVQEVVYIFSGQSSEYLLFYIFTVIIAVLLNHFAHHRTLAPWMLLMASIKVQFILLYSVSQSISLFQTGEILFYMIAVLPVVLLVGVMLILLRKKTVYKLLVFILTLYALFSLIYLYISTSLLDAISFNTILIFTALIWPLFAIRLVGRKFMTEQFVAKQ